MTPERYALLWGRAAAAVMALPEHQRDRLATEALMADAVFQATISDPQHQRDILDALAPSYAAQLRRVHNVAAAAVPAEEKTA